MESSFVQDLEEKVLNVFNINLPFYFRYDDIIMAPTKISYLSIKSLMVHNWLQFTIEYEENHNISFLNLK